MCGRRVDTHVNTNEKRGARPTTRPDARTYRTLRPAGGAHSYLGRPTGQSAKADDQKGTRHMVLFRHELGDVLRDARRHQGKTLRQVSADAQVSLGYLSEIERGQKEASSELLASITEALGYPMSIILREVAERVAVHEGIVVPDTVPVELEASALLAGTR